MTALRTVAAVSSASTAARRRDPYVDAGELLKALSAPVRLAIVAGERRGREVAYALADEHVAHIVADAVAHVQEQA